MSEKSYHHGNLKNELIEQGLQYISTNGVDSLSMRKLATVCGVSSAAPYAHFKNKDEFLFQARDYVEEIFSAELEKCIKRNKDPRNLLVELGVCYVKFFIKNPHYHRFMFSIGRIKVDEFKPFQIFSEASRNLLEALGRDEETIRYNTILMWAEVQGLTDICTVSDVFGKKKLDKEIERVLKSVSV